jgi:hypothetical protein
MSTHYWQAGDAIAMRWLHNRKVFIAQPMRVVKDTPDETALLLVPGASCAVQEDVWRAGGHQALWPVLQRGEWQMRRHVWHSTRMLMLVRSADYYSVCLFWDHSSNTFDCYYVNFQLPFTRSHCGFDSFDLELDIVVKPDGAWQWKDEAGYREGIQAGCIAPEWVAAIDQIKGDVIDAIGKRAYPFDQTWVHYQPDPRWSIPELPDGWNRVAS